MNNEYEHPSFPEGTLVFISSDILSVHEKSPIAGKRGVSYKETALRLCETLDCTDEIAKMAIADTARKARVPVIVEGSRWYPQQQYVKKEEEV